jgi:putative transposase
VIDFMQDHHDDYGVAPMCKVLRIAPSTWYARAAKKADPDKRSKRAKADAEMSLKIRQAYEENFGIYGVRKIWHTLKRQEVEVARCTVARLMKAMGLQGVIRGKPVKTTVQDKKQPCPLDHLNRIFKADRPNQLWDALLSAIGPRTMARDFTYAQTWAGFVYVAFVIDVYSRVIVGWKASATANADFVLDALDQALHARRPAKKELIHHSDRGSQYLSIKYTEKLAEAGIQPSVGSVGDSYDNALAETINGLYKAEVIHRSGPWRRFQDVEYATLNWVTWFNNQRLLEPIGVRCTPCPRHGFAALPRPPNWKPTITPVLQH